MKNPVRPEAVRNFMAGHERPIPPSYWLTSVLASAVVLFCYGTVFWYPRFADMFLSQFFSLIPFPRLIAAMAGTLVGLIVVSGVCIALRWAWVGLVLVLVPFIPSLLDETPLNFGVLAGLAAVALTASWRRPWASVTAIGSALLVLIWWVSSGRDMDAPLQAHIELRHANKIGVLALYTVVLPLVLGGALLLRRSGLREEQRRSLAARSFAVEEQSAVVVERARLARDLHDVVAHHVSLIAVRAETAPYTEADLSDGAKGLLADIAADARLALDELRGVLGILGRSGEDPARAPQPGWGDIASLLERSRSSGQQISVAGGLTGVVTPATGYAAYRVVQEALTNARKHAPGEPVRLDLSQTGRLVRVRVENDLSAGHGQVRGAGQGLVGMRERVSALGGTLQSGQNSDVFVIEAHLPQGSQ